jgi:hypothetical protein
MKRITLLFASLLGLVVALSALPPWLRLTTARRAT